MFNRRTLAASFSREGVGAFSGDACRVEVQPGPWGSGLVLVTEEEQFRAEPGSMGGAECPVFFGELSEVGATAALFASLFALGVTDARIVCTGGEIPALDGTAAVWLAAIDGVGVVDGPEIGVRVITAPVMVTTDEGYAALVPGDGCEVAVRLDEGEGCTGEGRVTLNEGLFRDELAWSRRVVLDLEARQAEGSWLGTHEANAVVSAHALKSEDEGVRRLMVQAIGDLAALGPVRGRLELFGDVPALRAALLRAVVEASA